MDSQPGASQQGDPPKRRASRLRYWVAGATLLAVLAAVAVVVVRASTSHARHVGATGSPPAGVSVVSSTVESPSPSVTGTVNIYANAGAGHLSPAVAGVPTRAYVPNSESNSVDVVDPTTFKILWSFPVPRRPQHVVPSADFKTLYVNSDLGNTLTPIDPVSGKPSPPIPVTDPYNLYFTPDGTRAIVVPEKYNSLDFRDPHTWVLEKRLPLPCMFPNHMDFTADLASLVVSCEGSGQLVRVNLASMTVTGVVRAGRSPQDIRLSADGKVFFVADQDDGGVEVIDAATLAQIGFIPTGRGAHGMYPSRDGTRLYVSNRLQGTISVIDYATRHIVETWGVPGGSPDMGGVSADGTQLWLSGRYNSEVYVIDTRTGALKRFPVGKGPHGLCLFPQPGLVSLGHTGNYR